MINLHFIIAISFLVVGFCMRFGLWNGLVIFSYERIPKLNKEKFDEYEIRRFVGETSIKLGVIILAIALVGIFDKKNFNLAVALGWFSFVFYAVASVTFIDKVDIFDKRRKSKQKARLAQAKEFYESADKATNAPDTADKKEF